MSAIKNIGLKIFFPFLLLLIFFSCEEKKKPPVNNPNEITFIGLSYIGGTSGYYKIVKITKDSLHIEEGATEKKSHKEWNTKTNPKDWENLVSKIDVKILSKIKSSPSAQSVNKLDETFQIRTREKAYFYVNSNYDTLNYKELKALKEKIQKIIPKKL